MQVVEVIPIGNTGFADTLSYFGNQDLSRGDIVAIPLRKKILHGVVIKVTNVEDQKQTLRSAAFTLRKLPPKALIGRLSDTFLKLLDHVCAYEIQNPSNILKILLPIAIRSHVSAPPISSTTAAIEPQLFQALTHHRFVEYKRIIRGVFANTHSVLFVVPTIEEAIESYTLLSKGLERHTVLLHGALAKSVLEKNIEKATKNTHPLLIITTPPYAFFERTDTGMTIIEQCRAQGYKGAGIRHFNYTYALLKHAELRGQSVLLGDTFPSADDEEKLRSGIYVEYTEHPRRIAFGSTLKAIDRKPSPDGTRAFELFSKKLVIALEDTLRHGGRAFLYAARKGLAPLVACSDCGLILRDPESGAPLSLHRTIKNGKEQRILFSATTGYRQVAYDTCPQCNSWRLREKGIGVQHVYDDLKSLFPKTPIILFDHETASTHKRAVHLRDRFENERGAILLGTPRALPYIKKPVTISAIMSMDSLLAIPSWRQQEEVFGTLLTLREKTSQTVYVQSFTELGATFEYAARGETRKFYDEEIAVRKSFSYPPFATFILLTLQSTPEEAKVFEKEAQQVFASYNRSVYTSPSTETAKIRTTRCLIRVPGNAWPDEKLKDLVSSFPFPVRIEINPDRIV